MVIETNAQGGKGAKIETAFLHLNPRSWLRVAAVKAEGSALYGPENWKKVPVKENLEHAMRHILLHEAGDTEEDHLGHAACRLMMAISIDEEA